MTLRPFGSFALAAIAGFALTINAFIESFHSARLGAVLVIVFLLHLLRYPRFLFCREFAMYTVFVGYMYSSLLWTADVTLAMNTLGLAQDFVIILILFGSLVTYHNPGAVLAGTLAGFLIGAAFYAFTGGFPFVYPADFSYNSIAGMYLFGLFITLVFGWYTRLRVLALALGLVLLVHITATTSIKTNLGIVLGAAAASLMYRKPFLRVLRRNAIPLVAIAAMLAYAILSNNALVETIQTGIERVRLGVEILKSGTDMEGYSGFAERTEWTMEGLKEWEKNPIFGHGVEAFRDRYGITSHSTLTDLLYNSGLIGLVLFYGMFISVAWRLFRVRDPSLGSLHAPIFGALVCYLFISLSGTVHYNTFLAVFIAISTALVSQHRRQIRPGVSSMDARRGAVGSKVD